MSINSHSPHSNDHLFSVDLAEGLADLDRVLINLEHGRHFPPKTEQQIDRDKIARLLDDYGDHAAAARFSHCGEGGLGWVGVCSDNPDHPRHYVPFYCELRICPECASRRTRALAADLTQPIIDYVAGVPRWKGYRLRHVTLTTLVGLDQDTAEVARKLQRWRVGIRQMFQAMYPDDPHLGGIIGAEFGEHGRKLHYHVLLFSKWIDQATLGRAWRELTGGEGRIYWIQAVKTDRIHKAVLEVCKYATKPAAFEGENLEELLARLHMTLKGIRRVQPFGSFYNLPRKGKSDLVCKECGAVLDWLPEMAVLESAAAGSRTPHECGNLNLIHPNNLSGQPPPTVKQVDQLALFPGRPAGHQGEGSNLAW